VSLRDRHGTSSHNAARSDTTAPPPRRDGYAGYSAPPRRRIRRPPHRRPRVAPPRPPHRRRRRCPDIKGVAVPRRRRVGEYRDQLIALSRLRARIGHPPVRGDVSRPIHRRSQRDGDPPGVALRTGRRPCSTVARSRAATAAPGRCQLLAAGRILRHGRAERRRAGRHVAHRRPRPVRAPDRRRGESTCARQFSEPDHRQLRPQHRAA